VNPKHLRQFHSCHDVILLHYFTLLDFHCVWLPER
jgi:hypothetical protein